MLLVVRAGGVKIVDQLLNMMLSGRREVQGNELAKLITSNRGDVVDALVRRQISGGSDPTVEALTKAILLGSSPRSR